MQRFKYHFEPQKGWMNDPNGLLWFKGCYHAFFQHNPYDTKWDRMHWGHAVSRDLIHWEEREIALFPDMDYENDGGCYSGNAIEKDGIMYLFYTSVSKELGQTQSVAFSKDGISFTKYENNPVIRHFPKDCADKEFRDPFVFKYGDEYRMLVGTQYNGRGRIVQYRSDDLFNWEFLGVIYESLEYNWVIECPNLFKIEDRWVLVYSKMGNPPYPVQFITGDFDGKKFYAQEYLNIEGGPQFYAPQTFLDKTGKRIIIGWYYDWIRKPDEDALAAGAFSAPRELLFENGILKMRIIESAAELLRNIPIEKEKRIFDTSISGIRITVGTDCVIVSNCGSEVYSYRGMISTLSVLEDEKGIEGFINDGEHTFSVWRNSV